jgi:hypothetical protein
METEKTHKRSWRKILRNIWLISIPVFVVGVIGFRFLGWEAGLPRTTTLLLMGLSALFGSLSFMVWVSILIFSNKFSRIVTILLGIFMSSLYALTAYSIAYIYAFSRVSQDSTNPLVFLDMILPLVAFGLVLFVWLKTKPILIKAAIVALLVGLYLFGRSYAVKAYEPLKQAFNYVNQAQSGEGLAWTKETNREKYLEGEKNYVDLYKKAADLIKNEVFRSWAREYFDNLYQLKKSSLDYDEQILTGKLVPTQEEIDKVTAETIKKRDSVLNTGFLVPFWVEFFRVR